MNQPPNRADFQRAFARRLRNYSKSLEMLARSCRGEADKDKLAAAWEAQRILRWASGEQERPEIPDGMGLE